MNLNPYEFEKAKDGDLFVKKGERLVGITKNELLKEEIKEIKKVAELEHKYEVMSKSLAKFERHAKRHFICVFNLFCNKVISGELEIEDENLLKLDELVINETLSVAEALNKHEFLKNTFDALYGEEYDNLKKLGGK